MSALQGRVIEIKSSPDAESAKNVGQSLKEVRKLSGLTQAEIAKRLDVSQASVSRLEAGWRDLQVSALQEFVEALGGTIRITAGFPTDGALTLHVRNAFQVGIDYEDRLVLPTFDDDPFRPQRDVVLSIRPKYTSRIMAGEKTVELRRRFPASAPEGTIAYIYSTSPDRAMVGLAEIARVRKLELEEIWRRYADTAFVERTEFDSYFEGLDQGLALEIENVRPFATPLSLCHLRERFGFEPPQSFFYAKKDLRRALKDDYATVSH